MGVAIHHMRRLGKRCYMGASYDIPANIRVFAKHFGPHLEHIHNLKGVKILDVTDYPQAENEKIMNFYKSMFLRVDRVTCNSNAMKEKLSQLYSDKIDVIFDPYLEPSLDTREVSEDIRIVWFGHSTNFESLKAVIEDTPIDAYDRFDIVCDVMKQDMENGKIRFIPWNIDTQRRAIKEANVALVTTNKSEASSNRVLECLNAGLPVYATPNPANLDHAPYISCGHNFKGWLASFRDTQALHISNVNRWKQNEAQLWNRRAAGKLWENVFSNVYEA